MVGRFGLYYQKYTIRSDLFCAVALGVVTGGNWAYGRGRQLAEYSTLEEALTLA
uniref:Uncharacterized protein n=1 Tax=Romanomermis culicivorax TaxID=13658 RepID=A0A915JVF8_ROMCU